MARHRRTSMCFCVWEPEAICLVSVVFDRWVAHCFFLTFGLLSFRAILVRLGSLLETMFVSGSSLFDVFCPFLGAWGPLGHPSGPHLASKTEKERKHSEKLAINGDTFRPLRSFCATWGPIWRTRGAKRASRRRPRAILWTS